MYEPNTKFKVSFIVCQIVFNSTLISLIFNSQVQVAVDEYQVDEFTRYL